MFANPVPGRIQGPDEPWAGVGTFIVTSSFQEHIDSGRGAGIDLGDGRCDDPVFAMEAGSVSFAGLLGAAKVVRVLHPHLGPSNESGYAHLSTIEVSVGQSVAKGQRIGTVGMTGADACHLHGGYKVNGVEVDWWPLLDQNAGGDMTTIVNAEMFRPEPRPVDFVAGSHTGYHLDGDTRQFTVGDGGSWAHADARCGIEQTPQIAPNGYPFVRMTDGMFAADGPWYVVEDGARVAARPDPVTPPPEPPPDTGDDSAELAAAKLKIASLEQQLADEQARTRRVKAKSVLHGRAERSASLKFMSDIADD